MKEKGTPIDEQSACLAILAIVRSHFPRRKGFTLQTLIKDLQDVMEQMIISKVHMSSRIARVILRELDSLASQSRVKMKELKVITLGLIRMMGFKLGTSQGTSEAPPSFDLFDEGRPPDSYLFLAVVDHLIAGAERDAITVARRIRRHPTAWKRQRLFHLQSTFLQRHTSIKPFVEYLEVQKWNGLRKDSVPHPHNTLHQIRARLSWMEVVRSHLLLRYYVLASDFDAALQNLGNMVTQRSLLVQLLDGVKNSLGTHAVQDVEKTLYTVDRFLLQGFNRVFAVAIGQANVNALVRILTASTHLLQDPKFFLTFETSWKRALSLMTKGTAKRAPAPEAMFSAIQLLLKIAQVAGQRNSPYPISCRRVLRNILKSPERRARLFVRCLHSPLMSTCKAGAVNVRPNMQDVIEVRLKVLMDLFKTLLLKKPASLTMEKVKVVDPERRRMLVEFLDKWSEISDHSGARSFRKRKTRL
ncbi:hypothetical protein FRC03_000350 [Tulasnella sp. 419]|nr:hypothetical protein FRC03_000350 [Tulasnella sp. 419]